MSFSMDYTSPELKFIEEKINPLKFPNMDWSMKACLGCILNKKFTEPHFSYLFVSKEGRLYGVTDNTLYDLSTYCKNLAENFEILLDISGLDQTEKLFARSLYLGSVKNSGRPNIVEQAEINDKRLIMDSFEDLDLNDE